MLLEVVVLLRVAGGDFRWGLWWRVTVLAEGEPEARVVVAMVRIRAKPRANSDGDGTYCGVKGDEVNGGVIEFLTSKKAK